MEKVQEVLVRLSALSRETSDALRRDDGQRVHALDAEIEMKIGEKERAMGALREHEREHGC